MGIHAPLDALPDEDGRFRIELDLQGMNALEVVPLGQDSRFHLSGNWPHPNFLGDFRPVNAPLRIRVRGKLADQLVRHRHGEPLQPHDEGERAPNCRHSASAWCKPVDHYQLNERAAKYALLFIGLTFISFFMFELLKGLRVHPSSTRWWAWGWPSSSIWCCWR